MVYLAAGLPLEGRSVLEATGGATSKGDDGQIEVVRLKSDDTGMSRMVRRNADGRMECVSFELARDYFYHDCDEDTAKWAYSMFTPAPVEFLVEPVIGPAFWKADLPRSYVLCLRDRAKSRAMSDLVIHRLGVAPLSHRYVALALRQPPCRTGGATRQGDHHHPDQPYPARLSARPGAVGRVLLLGSGIQASKAAPRPGPEPGCRSGLRRALPAGASDASAAPWEWMRAAYSRISCSRSSGVMSPDRSRASIPLASTSGSTICPPTPSVVLKISTVKTPSGPAT